jgi:hypothetical protein
MINTIGYQAYINTYSAQLSVGVTQKSQQTTGQDTLVASLSATSDKVTLGSSTETSPTYTNPLSTDGVKGDGFDVLRGLVLNMLKEQGINFKIADGGNEIDLSKITQADAQKLVAKDGYFGVDQTSDRIVNFAIGLAGGDATKIDAIKEGVDNGYQEALKAFGGTLPDISHQTYDAVMTKLDAWVKTANDSQVTQPTG